MSLDSVEGEQGLIYYRCSELAQIRKHRRCPGMHFAMQSIWYTIATILACFDISPVVGEDNVLILPALEFEDGVFR